VNYLRIICELIVSKSAGGGGKVPGVSCLRQSSKQLIVGKSAGAKSASQKIEQRIQIIQIFVRTCFGSRRTEKGEQRKQQLEN